MSISHIRHACRRAAPWRDSNRGRRPGCRFRSWASRNTPVVAPGTCQSTPSPSVRTRAQHRRITRAALRRALSARTAAAVAPLVMDVVDQHHCLAGKARARLRRSAKAPATALPAPPRPARATPASPSHRRSRSGIDGTPCAWSSAACAPAWVVAARPQPPAMERHRNEQIGFLRHQPGHRHRAMVLGAGKPARIFELERHSPRHLATGNRGADPVMRRRIGDCRRRSGRPSPRS